MWDEGECEGECDIEMSVRCMWVWVWVRDEGECEGECEMQVYLIGGANYYPESVLREFLHTWQESQDLNYQLTAAVHDTNCWWWNDLRRPIEAVSEVTVQ